MKKFIENIRKKVRKNVTFKKEYTIKQIHYSPFENKYR